ncbi:MAG: 5'/3'-nucleotidase SurE [Eubacteriales bacterium]
MLNILVTNDDGIHAKGINYLVKTLSKIAKVYVCAPDTQKSACGHGITVASPITIKEVEIDGAEMAWKISGTPADCVKLSLKLLLDKEIKIDLVFSGINHGPNLGTDTLYSGTVSGAIEGLICGIKAVAISTNNHKPENFQACEEIILQSAKIAFEKLDKNTILNINVPDIPFDQIKGTKITRLGAREYDEWFELRKSPAGQNYVWYSGAPVWYENSDEDIDVIAIQNDYISITPMLYDLTNFSLIEDVKTWGFTDK